MPPTDTKNALFLPISDEEKAVTLYICRTEKEELASLDPARLQKAKSTIERMLSNWEPLIAPIGNTRVRDMLKSIAKTLRVPPLDEDQMSLYCTTLNRLPVVSFNVAWRTVLATHKYKNMPLPAEFALAGTESQKTTTSLVSSAEYYIRKINRAMEGKTQ